MSTTKVTLTNKTTHIGNYELIKIIMNLGLKVFRTNMALEAINIFA